MSIVESRLHNQYDHHHRHHRPDHNCHMFCHYFSVSPHHHHHHHHHLNHQEFAASVLLHRRGRRRRAFCNWGGGVFCYTHFIRSVSLISPIAKPALGRKPAGQFLLRSHTLVLGGKDISRSDSRKSLVDELSPKQLARVLRGLNACHSTCLRESYNAKHAIMELSSVACDPCRGRGLRPDCQTASPKLQYSLNPHSQSFPV